MKKLVNLLLVAILALTIVACEAKANEKRAQADEKPANTQVSDSKKELKEISAAELLQNKNARLAISLAVEKNYITEEILGDGSKPIDFYIPVGLAFDESGKDFREKYPEGWNSYNLEKAKEYWAKAKEELKFDKVKLTFLTYDQEARKKVSEYVQAQLMKNLDGIEITLNIQPLKNKIAMSDRGEYDMELASWGAQYADPLALMDHYLPGAKLNINGYKEKDVQDIIASAKFGELLKTPAKRWSDLQEIEKLFVERDVAVAPLYQNGNSYLQSKEVTGLKMRSASPEYYFADATTNVLTDGKKIIRMTLLSDMPTLNSTKATDGISFSCMGNTIGGLVYIDNENKVVPRLASSWKISEDGLKYTFDIRKDAKWSNGAKVRAQDFEFAFKLLADPANASIFNYMTETAGLKNASKVIKGEMPLSELGVKAIDDYTLELTLDAPVPYLLRVLSLGSFCPINEKFYNENKDTYGTSAKTTLYCGPYIVSKWETGYGYTLEKNPNYYDAKYVKNDGVTCRVVKDTAAGVNMYKTGEVDRCQLSGEYADQFKDRADYEKALTTRITYLIFNQYNRK